MHHIGRYDGKEVYLLERKADIPKDTTYLYVSYIGGMYFGGVRIGKLDMSNYKVLEYDMGIYTVYKKAQATRMKQHEKEVPVATCMAQTTNAATTGTMSSNDEFFARIALEIEELLTSAKDFSYEVESWNSV